MTNLSDSKNLVYKAKHKIRFVTAASLFDGHDASINIMRRILQASGVEVIHLPTDAKSLVEWHAIEPIEDPGTKWQPVEIVDLKSEGGSTFTRLDDGSYLAEFLLEKGYEVHGIKRRSSLFNTGRIDHIYQDPHNTDPGVLMRLPSGGRADP